MVGPNCYRMKMREFKRMAHGWLFSGRWHHNRSFFGCCKQRRHSKHPCGLWEHSQFQRRRSIHPLLLFCSDGVQPLWRSPGCPKEQRRLKQPRFALPTSKKIMFIRRNFSNQLKFWFAYFFQWELIDFFYFDGCFTKRIHLFIRIHKTRGPWNF